MAERIGLQAVFEVDAFSNGLAVYLRGTAQAEAATSRTASAINSAGVGIAAGFGAAMGTVAVQAIQSFVSSTASALESAFSLASAFEQLEFSIRALGASQELLSGSTEEFSQIFEDQKEVASGYLLLLQDLAIPSIFTTQQIAAGQRMLQVFGFVQDEAFELNKLLVNFATAGNLSSEVMGRIAYAMGQVATEGRLLATETRQFANAGIPLIDILANKLGKTTQQIRADMKEGLLTADVVLPALIDYFQNFSGVTAESEKTLRGMASALQDVKEIAVSNFMRALIEPVVPLLQSIIRIFTDENLRAGATALGELLGPKLAQAIAAGVRAIMSFMDVITSLSPQTVTFIAILGGGIAVLTAFAAAAGVISLAMGLLVTSFTLPVAAVASFVAAYATNFGNLNTITNNVINAVTSTISNAIGGFNDFASGIADALNSAAQSMGNFLGQVADWGSQIVSTLAEGITSAVSVVVDAIGVLASAISYLMAPGSPPRMLPKLTEWGKSTAEEWLHGWTQADFSILNDITNFVETALGKGASSDELIKVNETIAQAVYEIRNIGQVSEDTFSQIQNSLGGASDEVFGYLERYEELASATNILEHAQEKLNQTTQHYDDLISPLKQKLDAASEAVTRAKEATELKGLEILLNTAGVSDTRKAEALARIQQINARQQVSDLETQKQAAVDKIQTEIDGATKLQESAQNQLDLFQQRIQLQNEFISLIEKESQASASGASSVAKAQKEGLSALDKQLKIIQLQQAELQDMIAAAKARKVLEDENATAAQKTTAQLELQAIATRQQLRDIEAAKLGTTLDAIREIQIVADDLSKPAKGGAGGKLAGIAAEFEVLSDADPEGRLAEFRTKVDELKTSFETMGTKIEEAATKANANLPVFLRFFNEPGTSGPPPLIANLTGALTALAAFKFASITAGLLGLGPAGAIAAVGIGAFVAAFNIPVIKENIEAALNGLFPEGTATFATMAANVYSAISTSLGAEKTVDTAALKTNIENAINNLFNDPLGTAGSLVSTVQAKLDLLFGEVTFSDLTASFTNLNKKVGDAIKSIPWLIFSFQFTPLANTIRDIINKITWDGVITVDIFEGLKKAVVSAISGAFTALGGDPLGGIQEATGGIGEGLGEAMGAFSQLTANILKEIPLAKISAGISDAVVSILGSGISGALSLISSTLEGFTSLKQMKEGTFTGGSAAQTISQKITETLLGAIAGIIKGAFDLITSGKLLDILKSIGNILLAVSTVFVDVIVGIFKGVGSTISQLIPDSLEVELQNQISAILRKIFRPINSIIRQINDLASQAGIDQLVGEITLPTPKITFASGEESLLAQVITGAGGGATANIGQKLADEIQKQVDAIKLKPPDFDVVSATTDMKFSEIGRKLGVNILDGFKNLTLAEKENAIGSLVKLDKAQLDTVFATSGQAGLQAFLGGFTPTATEIAEAKAIYASLGLGIVGGLESTEVEATAIRTYITDLLTSMKTAAQVESPSELTETQVGMPMGEGVIVGFMKALENTTELMATLTNLIAQIVTKHEEMRTDLASVFSGMKTDSTSFRTQSITAWTSWGTRTQSIFKSTYDEILENTKSWILSMSSQYSTLRSNVESTVSSMASTVSSSFSELNTALASQSSSKDSGTQVGAAIGQSVISGAIESLQNTEVLSVATQNIISFITTSNQTLRTNISTIQAGMLLDATLFQTNSVIAWTGWTTNVQTLIQGMYTLLNTETTTFSTDMQSKYVTLQSSLQSTVNSMTRIVTSLFSQMHSAVNRELSSMIEDILSKLAKLLEDIQENFVNEGEELGTDFAQGIVKGMRDHIEEIRKAAAELAQEAVSAAQEALVAKSPSEVTEKKVGGAFGQGATLGVLRSIPSAISAVNQLVDSMVSQAGYALDSSARSYGSSSSTVNNSKHYHLNVQSAQQSRGIVYDYGIMQLMEGS